MVFRSSELVVCALCIHSVTESKCFWRASKLFQTPNWDHLPTGNWQSKNFYWTICCTWSSKTWQATGSQGMRIWISAAFKVSKYICIELRLQNSLDVTHLSEWICPVFTMPSICCCSLEWKRFLASAQLGFKNFSFSEVWPKAVEVWNSVQLRPVKNDAADKNVGFLRNKDELYHSVFSAYCSWSGLTSIVENSGLCCLIFFCTSISLNNWNGKY